MRNRKDSVRKMVNLGAEIGERIKQLYYPNHKWKDCAVAVALKLTIFKQILRKSFTMTREEDDELLGKVRFFSIEDIKEVFEMEKDHNYASINQKIINYAEKVLCRT